MEEEEKGIKRRRRKKEEEIDERRGKGKKGRIRWKKIKDEDKD